MTKAKQFTIKAYIVMRNHHERLLAEAINRNDATAVAHETKVLNAMKLMLA